MNRAAFFEAANELSNWVEGLFLQTQASLLEAEDNLCRRQEHFPGALPNEAIVVLCVRAIGSRLQEVETAYARLCRATGLESRFE
jgi:hypothetical protein